MVFEEIDLKKVRQEKNKIEVKLVELKKIESELNDLDNLEKLINWYFSEKNVCEKVVPEMIGGKPTGRKMTPYAVDSNFKAYRWLSHYPFLALNLGWENASRFVSASDTEKGLEEKSKSEMTGLISTPRYGRIRRFLLKFEKGKTNSPAEEIVCSGIQA